MEGGERNAVVQIATQRLGHIYSWHLRRHLQFTQIKKKDPY